MENYQPSNRSKIYIGRLLKQTKLIYQLTTYFLYLGLGILIQNKFIHEFPHHIHAWAHCDHLALSHGFLENDFDFFHPETYTSYKQFQAEKDPNKLTNVTSTDFPLIQYTAGIWMKIFGTKEAYIYRLWMLLISCVGLLFLFKISYHFCSNYVVSFILPTLLSFSPLYLDYQIGFLPSMAGLSMTYAGIYYYIKHLHKTQTKWLIYSISILSVASAIRLPFSIALIGILLNELLTFKRTNLLICLAGMVLPVLYFFFNSHLRYEYGSIFLGSPLYARNLEELRSNFSEAFINWKNSYYSTIEWMLVIISIISFLVLKMVRQNLLKKYNDLSNFTLIYASGVLIYMILMSRQFVHHDYYALDTFIPLTTLITLVLISIFIQYHSIKFISASLIIILSYLSISQSMNQLENRRDPSLSQPYTEMYKDYQHLNALLLRNEISDTQEILILDPLAPNMPFIINERKGINVMNFKNHSFEEIMNWPFDLIILRDDLYYSDNWGINLKILESTQVLDYGMGLLLLEKSQSKKENIHDWLNIDSSECKNQITFENLPHQHNPSDFDICIEEYGMTYRDTIKTNDYQLISFSCLLSKKDDSEAFWHIHIKSIDDEDLFNQYIQINQNQETYLREIILPKDLKNWVISSYIYNPNHNEITYQNLSIKYF